MKWKIFCQKSDQFGSGKKHSKTVARCNLHSKYLDKEFPLANFKLMLTLTGKSAFQMGTDGRFDYNFKIMRPIFRKTKGRPIDTLCNTHLTVAEHKITYKIGVKDTKAKNCKILK